MANEWQSRRFGEAETGVGSSDDSRLFESTFIEDSRNRTSAAQDARLSGGGSSAASLDSRFVRNTESPYSSDGVIRTRAPYGNVAQPALDATSPNRNAPDSVPQRNGYPEYRRAPYGNVAQPALDATSPNRNAPDSVPQRNGYPEYRRAPYGQVAQPALDSTAPVNPNVAPQPFRPPYVPTPAPVRQPYVPTEPARQPYVPVDRAPFRPPYEPAPVPVRQPYMPAEPARQPYVPTEPARQPYVQPGLYPPGYVPGQSDSSHWTPSASQVTDSPSQTSSQTARRAFTSDGPDPREKEIVERSLHTHLNMTNYAVDSAVGGILGSGPLPWALDRMTAKSDSWFATRWREHGSPLGYELRAEQSNINRANNVFDEALSKQSRARSESLSLSKPLRDEMHAGRKTLDSFYEKAQSDFENASSPVQRELYQQKRALLETAKTNIGKLNATSIESAQLSAGKRVPQDGKFLTQTEAEFLSRQRQLHTERTTLAERYHATKSPVQQARAEVLASSERSIALKNGASEFNFFGTKKGPWSNKLTAEASVVEKVAGEWRGDSWKNKIGEGLAIGGVALAADWLGDKMLGHDQGTFSRPSYYLEYPLVAGVMLSPKGNLATKATLTAVGVIGAKLIDDNMPLPSASYSGLMAPNWIDAVGMSAAWMIPWSSSRARILGVVGAYGLGRAANVAHNWMDIPIPGMVNLNYGKELDDNVTIALGKDKDSYSHSDFKSIVDRGSRLGSENDGALKIQFEQFVHDHQSDANRVYYSHGSAALATSVGDMILRRGSKIDSVASMTKGRILAGTDYDMGGQALQYYRAAAGNLIELQNNSANLGLTQSQTDGIKESTKLVESRMSRIYGKHDVERVLSSLKAEFVKSQQDMGHFAVALSQEVKGLPASTVQNDPKYVAKLCRDVALLYMAVADYKASTHSNGGDASVLMQDAVRFLKGAEKWDPNSPDLPQLNVIKERLLPVVQKATKDQYGNSLNNPYSVPQTGSP